MRAAYGRDWNGELMLLDPGGRLVHAGHLATLARSLEVLEQPLDAARHLR
jgi:hypothetical protein